MQPLSRKIKLPPMVAKKLLACEDAEALAREYRQRYWATASRYQELQVSDDFHAVRNSALYYRRLARALELLARWLRIMDAEPALARLQSKSWSDVYRELGITEIDSPTLQTFHFQDSEGFDYTYAYDSQNLAPDRVPDWAVALITELMQAKWEDELALTLLQLHRRFTEVEAPTS